MLMSVKTNRFVVLGPDARILKVAIIVTAILAKDVTIVLITWVIVNRYFPELP